MMEYDLLIFNPLLQNKIFNVHVTRSITGSISVRHKNSGNIIFMNFLRFIKCVLLHITLCATIFLSLQQKLRL